MKWLQSPENQSIPISWDSHGKKNAERACSHLTFEQMLENLVSCLHGTGLLIPLFHCVVPSLAQFPLFQLCKHAVFARILMILWVVTGAMGITRVAAMVESVRRSQQVAGLFCDQHLDHVVPVNPSRPPQFHESYGWHSSLPHYRTSPLSCSWIHSSPWLAVPHRSPLLVGHLRTFINWAVFSGRWRSPWF